ADPEHEGAAAVDEVLAVEAEPRGAVADEHEDALSDLQRERRGFELERRAAGVDVDRELVAFLEGDPHRLLEEGRIGQLRGTDHRRVAGRSASPEKSRRNQD